MFGPVLFQGRYPSDWTEHLLAGWLASLADLTEPASSLNYIQKYFAVDLVAFVWSSSDTMSSATTFAEAHLQSLVSSLGRRRDCRLRDSPYVKDPMCHGTSMCFRPKATKVFNRPHFPETLQHFAFLRHDQSHERPVAFLLYSWDFLQTHLLPLVLTYHGSESLILDSGEEASIRSALVY